MYFTCVDCHLSRTSFFRVCVCVACQYVLWSFKMLRMLYLDKHINNGRLKHWGHLHWLKVSGWAWNTVFTFSCLPRDGCEPHFALLCWHCVPCDMILDTDVVINLGSKRSAICNKHHGRQMMCLEWWWHKPDSSLVRIEGVKYAAGQAQHKPSQARDQPRSQCKWPQKQE